MVSKRRNSRFLQVLESFGFQLDNGLLLFQTCLTHCLIWNPLPHPIHLNLMEDIPLLFGREPDQVLFLGLEEEPVRSPSASLCLQIFESERREWINEIVEMPKKICRFLSAL